MDEVPTLDVHVSSDHRHGDRLLGMHVDERSVESGGRAATEDAPGFSWMAYDLECECGERFRVRVTTNLPGATLGGIGEHA